MSELCCCGCVALLMGLCLGPGGFEEAADNPPLISSGGSTVTVFLCAEDLLEKDLSILVTSCLFCESVWSLPLLVLGHCWTFPDKVGISFLSRRKLREYNELSTAYVSKADLSFSCPRIISSSIVKCSIKKKTDYLRFDNNHAHKCRPSLLQGTTILFEASVNRCMVVFVSAFHSSRERIWLLVVHALLLVFFIFSLTLVLTPSNSSWRLYPLCVSEIESLAGVEPGDGEAWEPVLRRRISDGPSLCSLGLSDTLGGLS